MKEKAIPRNRKLRTPVTLFAAIESAQHDALRRIAFDERRSLADLVREALSELITRRKPARSVRTASARGR